MNFLQQNCRFGLYTQGRASLCKSFKCGDKDLDEFQVPAKRYTAVIRQSWSVDSGLARTSSLETGLGFAIFFKSSSHFSNLRMYITADTAPRSAPLKKSFAYFLHLPPRIWYISEHEQTFAFKSDFPSIYAEHRLPFDCLRLRGRGWSKEMARMGCLSRLLRNKWMPAPYRSGASTDRDKDWWHKGWFKCSS